MPDTNYNNIKIGIVGLGLVAEPNLKGYRSHPNAEVVAVCDVDISEAKKFSKKHDIANVYSSYEEMLNSDIDVVNIATPTHLHAPMTMQALNAEKHVHCEKPFCRYPSEGERAIKEANKQKLKIFVGETYLFISSHIKAKKLIDDGMIGTPLQIRMRHGAWNEKPISRINTGPLNRDWRMDPYLSGGGKYPWIFDHAVHFFATAEYFMQNKKINEVHAIKAHNTNDHSLAGAAHDPYITPVTDIPIITWNYEDKACQGLWCRAERLNGKWDFMQGFSTVVIGEFGMIEVLGEGGNNLIWNGEQQHLILHREDKDPLCFRFEEGGDDIWESDISYYCQGHKNQIHHFINSIVYGDQLKYSSEDALQAVRCTLAVIKSAEEGIPILVSSINNEYTAFNE